MFKGKIKNLLKTIAKRKVGNSEKENLMNLSNKEIYEKKLIELNSIYEDLKSTLNEEDLNFFKIGYEAIKSLDKKEKEYFFYKLFVEKTENEKYSLEEYQEDVNESFFTIRNQNIWENFQNTNSPLSAENEVMEVVEEKVIEEKKFFTVEITSIDAAKKLNIIKNIKTILNLGLKEAKDFVEKIPQILKTDVKKEEADDLNEKLTAMGCVVTIK